MILHTLISILFFFAQTPDALQEGETNVFVDLGTEHCANSIAIAAYENTGDAEFTAPTMPAYITYSAFEFETANQANDALDDIPDLVAETFSDDPEITEDPDYDRLVTEVETVEERGDRSVGYIMTLPVDDDELEVLTVEMMGIIKENQLLLILMFSETGTSNPSPGLSMETIPPFADTLEDDWTGHGALEQAIPEQDEMPIGWTGQDITTGELPTCEQQEQ